MFDHLLESSRRDDSNKWSNIGFGEEMIQGESIEVIFTHLIWSRVSDVVMVQRSYIKYPESEIRCFVCTSDHGQQFVILIFLNLHRI